MPSLSLLHSPDVVSAIWSRTRLVRNFQHGGRGCPTAPARAARMLVGAPVPVGCEECYDLLVDCVLRVRADADNPVAYAWAVARTVCASRMEQANAALHGVSRPDRQDGTVGRIRAALLVLPDGAWLDELLTLLLTDVSARTAVPRTTWRLEVLAEARAAAGVGPGDLRSEIQTVLDTVVRVAGPVWFDDFLQAPLRARTARFAALQVGAPGTPDVAADVVGIGDVPEFAVAFWALLRGNAPAAVQAATRELTGRTPERRFAARMAATLVADLPELRASHQARHGRPTLDSVRAAVARRCGTEVAAALDEATVRGACRLACAIPIELVASQGVA